MNRCTMFRWFYSFIILLYLCLTVGYVFAKSEEINLVSYVSETKTKPRVFCFNAYTLILQNHKGFLIDEEVMEVKSVNPTVFQILNRAKTIVFHGDVLECSAKQGKLVHRFSIKQIIANKQSTYSWLKWLFIYGFILFFIVICWILMKKRNTPRKTISFSTEHFLLKRIMAEVRPQLTVQELDLLFEIDKLSSDSRKLKRHRLIIELNSFCPGIIVRTKDAVDKRRNIYLLNTNR